MKDTIMPNPLLLGSDEQCAKEIVDSLVQNGRPAEYDKAAATIARHVTARTAELEACNAKLVEALERIKTLPAGSQGGYGKFKQAQDIATAAITQQGKVE